MEGNCFEVQMIIHHGRQGSLSAKEMFLKSIGVLFNEKVGNFTDNVLGFQSNVTNASLLNYN